MHRFHRAALTGFGFPPNPRCRFGDYIQSHLRTSRAGIGKGNLELGQRKELPGEAASVEGLIRLDATVTDQAGKAVAGLQLTDFRLLDNSQPQKIIAFRASKGAVASAEDSLTVIILLDTLGLTSYLANRRAATGGAIPASQIRKAGAPSDHLLAARFRLFPYCEVINGQRGTCHIGRFRQQS